MLFDISPLRNKWEVVVEVVVVISVLVIFCSIFLNLCQECVVLTSMEETNLLRKMTWMHPTVRVTKVSTLDMSR